MSDVTSPNSQPIFRVKTWGSCMEPLIGHEEHLLVKRCAFEEIQVGDVIYCLQDETFKFAHRVIAFRTVDGKRCIVTKPDQRDMVDPPTPEDRILGKVIGKYVDGQLVFSDFRLTASKDDENGVK